MTIFDIINSILFTKKKIELNCDDESQFSSFMVNRWLSFYSPEVAAIVNESTNKYNAFADKQQQYDIYLHLLPKMKFKRISYLKKTKKEATTEVEIHVPEFMSKKEYEILVDLQKELTI